MKMLQNGFVRHFFVKTWKKRRESHTLKGLLATIGDDFVYPAAHRLEEELNRKSSHEETVLRLIDQLGDEMVKLIRMIDKMTKEYSKINSKDLAVS
jgi:HPt (histidine-containing phosphotransfer) domain-containing protein